MAIVISMSIGFGIYLLASSILPRRQYLAKTESEIEQERAARRAARRNNVLTRLGHKVGLAPGQLQRALTLGVLGSGAGGTISWLIWNWPAFTLAGIVAGFIWPVWWMIGRVERMRLEFQESLAQAVDTLRNLLQYGGVGLVSAIKVLSETGPERLRADFATIHQDAVTFNLEDALVLAQDRLEDASFDKVAMSLIVAEKAGSRVGDVLMSLAETIRANLSINRQVIAEQSRHVIAARVIALLPILVLTFLKATGSNYVEPFDSSVGQIALITALLLLSAGYIAMRMVGRMPPERRTFK